MFPLEKQMIKKNCNEKKPVKNVERLIWKIAHYVWGHYLRQKTYLDKFVLTEAPRAEDTSDLCGNFQMHRNGR